MQAGYRTVVSHLVVGLIQDLAVLRRAGAWKDDPVEMRGLVDEAGGARWRKLPTQVRLAYQAGMWERQYLELVCAMVGQCCGVHCEPGQLIEAAKVDRILKERQTTGNRTVQLNRAEIHEAANAWCRDRGLEPMVFGDRLPAREEVAA